MSVLQHNLIRINPYSAPKPCISILPTFRSFPFEPGPEAQTLDRATFEASPFSVAYTYDAAFGSVRCPPVNEHEAKKVAIDLLKEISKDP